MLIYYRLPGVVASFALIYYALVVLAIFRLIPVTLTLAGIAGFVLSVGMAVDANILIFERMKEELRRRQDACRPPSRPASTGPGTRSSTRTCRASSPRRSCTCSGRRRSAASRLVLIIGVLVSMFTAIVVTRTILRVVVRQPWARKASLYGLREERVRGAGRRPGRPAGARRARVFDIIGKRRWFYLFSLIITIPGLIFILLTPFTRRRPAVHDRLHRRHRWDDPLRGSRPSRPTRSRPSSPSRASSATVIRDGDGFIEIRTEQVVGLREAPAPSASPAPAPRRPGARRRRPAAARARVPRPARARARRRPRPPRQPVGRAVAGRLGLAGRIGLARRIGLAGPAATGRQHRAPDRRASSARSRTPSRTSSGRSPSRPALTTIGAVVQQRPDPQALILIVVGSLGILLWITYRFRDVRFGVTALVSLLHDVIVVVGVVRDPRHVLPASRSTPCS